MTGNPDLRGGTTVSHISDLDAVSAAAVVYLRMWCSGSETQRDISCDLSNTLGTERGGEALRSFQDLCALCAQHGRRPLARHALRCKCVGADEACFANLISLAANGDRDDAMLIATLIVRPDVAPLITALATDFGMALKQMNLAAPKDMTPHPDHRTTFH